MSSLDEELLSPAGLAAASPEGATAAHLTGFDDGPLIEIERGERCFFVEWQQGSTS